MCAGLESPTNRHRHLSLSLGRGHRLQSPVPCVLTVEPGAGQGPWLTQAPRCGLLKGAGSLAHPSAPAVHTTGILALGPILVHGASACTPAVRWQAWRFPLLR